MQDRGYLLTEQRNEASRAIDELSVADAFDVMNGQDASIARAVASAKAEICRAIELVAAAFIEGGRLFYVGAGTSGRLGVIDAAECPPTFLTAPDQIQGIIAGGSPAMFRSVEAAEDDPTAGASAIDERDVTAKDVVFGITTGGTTPFVHGALEAARRHGAKTIFLACVPSDQAEDQADVSIRVLTGPEVITGSTRLKAGLATKMVLNMVSTMSMVRLGKVYENLMVDVNANGCAKLTDRAVRILITLTDLDRPSADRLLRRANGRVKTALVMHFRSLGAAEAEHVLADGGNNVRAVLKGLL